jgi:hypothetical protein
MNIRRFLRKSERGQAIAEYTVLFPPVLLLSMMVLIPVTERANYIFCRMVNALDPSVCEAWIEEPEDEQASPSEELCITLEEESGGSQCDQHMDCTLLPGLNYGSFEASKPIQGFVIKAGQEYHIYETTTTDDGCYDVTLDGNHVEWEKVGSGSGCKDISHNQVWKVALCQ